YGVWPRSDRASIIEFSKWVRRHQVTKLLGLPAQPLFWRNGVTASVSPFCMSTIVPYWSNTSTLMDRLSSSRFTFVPPAISGSNRRRVRGPTGRAAPCAGPPVGEGGGLFATSPAGEGGLPAGKSCRSAAVPAAQLPSIKQGFGVVEREIAAREAACFTFSCRW